MIFILLNSVDYKIMSVLLIFLKMYLTSNEFSQTLNFAHFLAHENIKYGQFEQNPWVEYQDKICKNTIISLLIVFETFFDVFHYCVLQFQSSNVLFFLIFVQQLFSYHQSRDKLNHFCCRTFGPNVLALRVPLRRISPFSAPFNS